MITRGVITNVDNFDRAQVLTTTPGVNGWTIKDTSSAGAPTYLCVTEDGGAMKLTIAATSEEEIVTMYQNDVLPIDLAMLQRVEFIAKTGAGDANTAVVFGVASAQADTEDSVAINAWFKIPAGDTGTVVVETDDGVTDNDDKATGKTLTTTYKKFIIDFTNGLSDVRFFIDGERVGQGTTFSMTGITAGQNVQPFVQVHKASGTGVQSFQIAQLTTVQRYAYGA